MLSTAALAQQSPPQIPDIDEGTSTQGEEWQRRQDNLTLPLLEDKPKDFYASIHIGPAIPVGAFGEGILDTSSAAFLTPTLPILREPQVGLDLAFTFDKFFSKHIGFSTTVGYLRFKNKETLLLTSLNYEDNGFQFVHACFGLIGRYNLKSGLEIYARVQAGISRGWLTASSYSFQASTPGTPGMVDVDVEVSNATDFNYFVNSSIGMRYPIGEAFAIGADIGYRHSRYTYSGIETEVFIAGAPVFMNPLVSQPFKLLMHSVNLQLTVSYAF